MSISNKWISKWINKCTFLCSISVGIASLGATAHSEEGSESKVEISGKIWAKYSYDLTKEATTSSSVHANGFDVYRAFLQANYKFNDQWSTRLLLDGARGAVTNDTSLWVYVRNAYIEGTNLWPDKGTFRFGYQPTPYISTVDAALKTRWLGKSLTDESTALVSQGGGLSFAGNLGTLFRYGLMIHNGMEGLTLKGNNDNATATGIFFAVSPFAGDEGALKKLSLSVYDEVQGLGRRSATAITTYGSNTLAVAVTYESDMFDGAVEIVRQKTNRVSAAATGYGLTGNVKFMEQASIYARFFSGNDQFRSASASLLNGKSLLSVGPTWSFVKSKLSTALIYEIKPSITAGVNASNSVMWYWAANF